MNLKPFLLILLAFEGVHSWCCCGMCPEDTTTTTTAAPQPTTTSSSGSIDYSSFDYGAVDSVVKKVLESDTVKSMTCTEEISMWAFVSQLAVNEAYLENVIDITQTQANYASIKSYISAFPAYYNKDKCEVDDFIKKKMAAILPNTGIDTTSIANPGDIENILSPIYLALKPYIDAFAASSMLIEHRKAAMAVTYTADFCLDVGLEFCYSQGFGFAFNFNEKVIYYKTGVEGLTIGATEDESLLPGSVSFSVAYDILGEIGYAPGNLYSLDVAISTGMLGQIMGKLGTPIFEDLTKSGYGFSYLVSVKSLALSDVFATDPSPQCIGFSFGNTLNSISGSIIPSVSFGISRAATVVDQKIVNNTLALAQFDDNECISEQLLSVTGFSTMLRPDIEL